MKCSKACTIESWLVWFYFWMDERLAQVFFLSQAENCSKKFALIGRGYIAWIFSTNHRAYKNHKPHHCKNTCWCAVTKQKQTIILKVLNWCFTEEAIRTSYKKSRDNTKTVRGKSVEFKCKYKCWMREAYKNINYCYYLIQYIIFWLL